MSRISKLVEVKSVKRNGTALTPDANGAVDISVPTKFNDVCPEFENWLGVPGTTSAGKSIKVLAKTVNGVIEGGMTVTGSSNNDNNTTKYRYSGVTVTRNGTATDYLFDSSQSGIARLSNVRYDMTTADELQVENDAATLVCADRTVTSATITESFSTLNLTFPEAINGKSRDFVLALTFGATPPNVTFPQGATILVDNSTDLTAQEGTNLYNFTEISANTFVVSRLLVTAYTAPAQ